MEISSPECSCVDVFTRGDFRGVIGSSSVTRDVGGGVESLLLRHPVR